MKINRVFLNNNPIIFTDELTYVKSDNFFKIEDIDLSKLVEAFKSGELKHCYLYGSDKSLLVKTFCSHFKIVKAAGGVVRNPEGEVLFILRNGVWDLPKGKIEKGEKKKMAALREVEEETGIENLALGGKLQTTFHIYQHKGKNVLKVTYWYEMTSDFLGVLEPQLEEGITKVEWLNSVQQNKAMENTYGNIRLLLEQSL